MKVILFCSEKRYEWIGGFLKRYYPEIKIIFLNRSPVNLCRILIKKYDADLLIEVVRPGVKEGVCRLCRLFGRPFYRELKDLFFVKQEYLLEEFERNWVAYNHIENMDSYFDVAEGEEMLSRFWGNGYPFFRMFSMLDQTKIIELACGRGRHVQKYLDSAGDITLVDILEKNIEICRERYKDNPKIHYYVNNGKDLSELPDSSYTAMFTYDAMVHFQYLDVNNYLKETFRVLQPGGYALFHHSNNDQDYKAALGSENNPKARAFMSKNLFAHMAYEAGFEIVEQHVLDWEGVEKIDCVTLLRKPLIT